VDVIPFLSFIPKSVDFIVNKTAFGGCTEILKNLDDGSNEYQTKMFFSLSLERQNSFEFFFF